MPQLQETYLNTVEERLAQLESIVSNLFTISDPWVKLYPDAQTPEYAHSAEEDAGMDLRAYINIDPFAPWYLKAFGDVWSDIFADAQLISQKSGEKPFIDLLPGECLAIPTGLAIDLPSGFEAQIRPRSGLAAKKLVTVLNTPGTIDPGYKTSSESLNEVCVLLYNNGSESLKVTHGDRIAQSVIARYVKVTKSCKDGFCPMPNTSAKRFSGFGSSGVK